MGHESGGSDKGLELRLECDAGGRDFEVLPEATERKDSLENSCVGSSEFLDDISMLWESRLAQTLMLLQRDGTKRVSSARNSGLQRRQRRVELHVFTRETSENEHFEE
ncbi:hypothetical protein CDAR_5621 [Caerostris darwini]|uniref:Uncharacterized protein n=1 Tax=Caerostris darwini TaxID=1538125 RepID=A0AAV4Q8Y5_9ARAC|nr:hypothetical protein CDAR_5621 [Caerostris darwini]